MKIPPLASALTACVLALGCGGYRPLQWPKRELFVAAPPADPPVFPSDDISAYPDRLEQQGVQVAIAPIDLARARTMFQAGLRSLRAQPLMLVIQNDSADPYAFRKTDVDAQYVPAGHVARRAFVHPYYSAYRTARWIVLLPLGIVVTSIIEPLSTIDFPGLEDLARRPPPVNQRAMEELVNHEIRDWDIAPKTSLAGLMFIRPPKPGSELTVALVNLRTQAPLIFKSHVYVPSLARQEVYPYSPTDVRQALASTVQTMRQWSLAQSDPDGGVVVLHRDFRFLCAKTTTRMRIAVRPLSTGHTQVEADAVIGGFDLVWRRSRSRSVDAFMERLGSTLAADYRRLALSPKLADPAAPAPVEGPPAATPASTP